MQYFLLFFLKTYLGIFEGSYVCFLVIFTTFCDTLEIFAIFGNSYGDLRLF